MYISSHEIAQSRDYTLTNFLEMSAACFAAGQQFSELFVAVGREAIQQGSKHFSLFGPGQRDTPASSSASLWLEHSALSSRVLDKASSIVGEAHKALIETANAQVRVFDQIVFATITRAARTSPWEGEIALAALRATLQSAEHTLHGISEAAIETVELAEKGAHQISESLTEQSETRVAVKSQEKPGQPH